MIVTICFALIHIVPWNPLYTEASSSSKQLDDFDALDEYCKMLSTPISTLVLEKQKEARKSESNKKVVGTNAATNKGKEKMEEKIKTKKGKAKDEFETKKDKQSWESIVAPRKDITAFRILEKIEKESKVLDESTTKNRVLQLYREYEHFLFEKPTSKNKKLLKNKKKICASYNNQLYGEKICSLLKGAHHMEDVAPVTCVKAIVNRMNNWGLRDVALCKMKLPETIDDFLITCPITGGCILKHKMPDYRKKNAIINVGILDGPAPHDFFIAHVHNANNPGAVTLVNKITNNEIGVRQMFESETAKLRKQMAEFLGDQVVKYAEDTGEMKQLILDRTIANTYRLGEDKKTKGTAVPLVDIVNSEIWKPIEDEETASKIKEEKDQILEAFKKLR